MSGAKVEHPVGARGKGSVDESEVRFVPRLRVVGGHEGRQQQKNEYGEEHGGVR